MTGQEVYDILVAQGVMSLHHANSVGTSISLLKLGGLASRQVVEQAGLPQTGQYTDDIDRKFDIWGCVFLDTFDIHARISNRNQYGPVLFTLSVEVLRGLPAAAQVLVTRKNPSKWLETDSDVQRCFLSAAEMREGFSVGTFDQMLVIRTNDRFVPFGQYLQTITLDEPLLTKGEGPEFRAAADALDNAALASGLQVKVMRRSCWSCKCTTTYASNSALIPRFYSPQ